MENYLKQRNHGKPYSQRKDYYRQRSQSAKFKKDHNKYMRKYRADHKYKIVDFSYDKYVEIWKQGYADVGDYIKYLRLSISRRELSLYKRYKIRELGYANAEDFFQKNRADPEHYKKIVALELKSMNEFIVKAGLTEDFQKWQAQKYK